MANEVIVTDLLGNEGDVVSYTCAAGTAIAKGEVMELLTGRTVQKISNVDKPIVGIAAYAKSATDGRTSIGVLTNFIGRVQISAGGTATIGDEVSAAAGDNTFDLASTLDMEKGWALGYALEDAGNGETCLVRVNKK